MSRTTLREPRDIGKRDRNHLPICDITSKLLNDLEFYSFEFNSKFYTIAFIYRIIPTFYMLWKQRGLRYCKIFSIFQIYTIFFFCLICRTRLRYRVSRNLKIFTAWLRRRGKPFARVGVR
jgi:hypothetical protein